MVRNDIHIDSSMLSNMLLVCKGFCKEKPLVDALTGLHKNSNYRTGAIRGKFLEIGMNTSERILICEFYYDDKQIHYGIPLHEYLVFGGRKHKAELPLRPLRPADFIELMMKFDKEMKGYLEKKGEYFVHLKSDPYYIRYSIEITEKTIPISQISPIAENAKEKEENE